MTPRTCSGPRGGASNKKGSAVDMLDFVKRALEEECAVDPDQIGDETHLLKDLNIDSLDLLNASFRIEKDCGVKLPFRAWMELEYGDVPVDPSPFLVREVCRYLDGQRIALQDTLNVAQ